MKIGKFNIGAGFEPFIIAEMSGNHNHLLERALQIIDEAALAGAHAIKIQTYTADTITLDSGQEDFIINDPKSLWNGQKLYDLYDKAHTKWEWHKPIFEHAASRGIICFSSPFDESAVDFLETLNAPAYKIASFECTHLPLIKKCAATGKPVIISTGIASEEEIGEAISVAKSAGAKDIMILKCTSQYPATVKDANLLTIPDMKKRFGVEVGLSDHTMGIGVALAAVVHGAVAIEKHFTLARADGGVDSAFSLEPAELKNLVTESKNAWEASGKILYGGSEAEQKSKQFRRSIYVAEDIKAGEIFTEKNIRIVRPGWGLEPKYYEEIIGKKAAKNAKKGTRLSWDIVES